MSSRISCLLLSAALAGSLIAEEIFRAATGTASARLSP